MDDIDLICSTADTIVDTIEDYYVPDKNDLGRTIHIDDVVLFATLFGRRKVFLSINFQSGFAADSAFYENASSLFRVKKVSLRTYVYYRNNPNSICSVLKKQNSLSDEIRDFSFSCKQ
jgi:hypothetical protein